MRYDGPDNRPTVASLDLELRVLNGPQTGRRAPIKHFPCMIGRGGRSRIVLADPDDPPGVSREHATISIRGASVVITDHSTNGTCVGDRWLARGETAELHPGMKLRLGPTLVLELSHADQTADPVEYRSVAPPVTTVEAHVRSARRLRDVITDPRVLAEAWHRVELNRGTAGPDNVTVHEFALSARRRLDELRTSLLRGTYNPLPPRLFAAPKRAGGTRTIAILAVQDRIVQQAIHIALQPILEPHFPPCSYAYRPGLCAHHALRAVDEYLERGLTWIAETDIDSFFDSISHRILLDKLSQYVTDSFTLTLIARCIAAGASAPGRGIPQGAGTSPLLSNLYLADFDRHMLDRGWNPVRYGDDMLFLCASRSQAQNALLEAEGYLRSNLQLALKADKTGVRTLEAGFTFLGFRFDRSGRRASPAAISRLNQRLQDASPAQTGPVVRGWSNYFGTIPEDSETDETHDQEPAPVERQPKPASCRIEEAALDKFLELFSGREDAYALQSSVGGKVRLTPCAGPLTRESALSHIAGSQTVASYLLRTDGTVKVIVLDLDADASAGGYSRGLHADDRDLGRESCLQAAKEIIRLCRTLGIPARLEDSGRKGFHIWTFFSEPVPAETARRLARLIVARAGFPRPGIRAEVFPRQTEWPGRDLGDAVKVPFGVHPSTGRRCLFLDDQGDPVTDLNEAIYDIRAISPADVEDLIQKLVHWGACERAEASRLDSCDTTDVAALVRGCSVLAALVERARTTGHLRHTHRLMLLYTFGRLGPEGRSFIHHVLANCRNYNPSVCQRYIDGLDPDHPAITCSRIREWLEDEGEDISCQCTHGVRSPVDLVSRETGKRKAARTERRPEPSVAQWSDEDSELFDKVVSDMIEEPEEDAEGGAVS